MILGKKPSKVEVYNDINGKMVSLFNVLSDESKTLELQRRLELTPYSREFFEYAKMNVNKEPDEIERARLMIVVQRQSHGGLGEKWSYCIKSHAAGYSASVRKFHAGIERLPIIQTRMRKVQVENLTFDDLIPRYDKPGILFYLDPPYIPETRVSGQYEFEMTVEDHERMVQLMLASDGHFILSGYNTDVYRPLELAGYRKEVIETSSNNSKDRNFRAEYLWISPNCQPLAPELVNSGNLTNRQLAAYRVHRQRRDNSILHIEDAISTLKRQKKRVTKVQVAKMTGISREHITRYYSDLF